MIEREKIFARNAFLAKRKAVIEGKSAIFKDWQAHSTITKEEFIEALDWLCSDPLDKKGRLTREIGLTPSGIIKLNRVYNNVGLCAFYYEGELWCGAKFTVPCRTEKERIFSLDGENLEFLQKISLSCKDRV